jgi:hypothetical protein
MLSNIKQYFEQAHLNYLPLSEDAQQHLFLIGMEGENSRFHCIADLKEDLKIFLFYSVCSVPIAPAQVSLLSAFLTAANYGRMLGNFEMNLADGEIRYKTSLHYGNLELTDVMIDPLVKISMLTMDQVIPIIEGLTTQHWSLEKAILKLRPNL